mmetsp:Transcript_19810/g.47458  ORF Transcript_19810/g.47458 Transcript_19810/m.47458 type:complete len:128 (+) Transcript_19810:484-867(+)
MEHKCTVKANVAADRMKDDMTAVESGSSVTWEPSGRPKCRRASDIPDQRTLAASSLPPVPFGELPAERGVPTVLHHLLQEFDDDFGARTDHNLALATLLSIEDAAKAVIEHGHTHHPDEGNVLQSTT